MIFTENWKPFVNGEEFSNGNIFTLAEGKGVSIDRVELLEELCNGKRVIHFGCADHIPLIKKKISDDKWLQDRLSRAASKCIGVDNYLPAIEFISQELGRTDCEFFELNGGAMPQALLEGGWDIILLGEILEHVDNPVAFLKELGERFRGLAKDVVVTVPNCFSWENIQYSIRNKEFINTDHRYWFSPYTIAKVAFHAGLELTEIKMCGSTGGRTRLYRHMTGWKPMLRETIVARLQIL